MMDHQETTAHLEHFLRQTALSVPAAFIDFVQHYLTSLEKWNRVYNLTAIPAGLCSLYRHILESLTLLPVMANVLPAGASCLDVGTGAGIPGLIVAAACPRYHMTLLDRCDKKMSFVRYMVAYHALSQVQCHQERIEHLDPAATYHCILSRAFANVCTLVECTHRYRHPEGIWLVMLGSQPEASVWLQLQSRYGVVLKGLYHETEVWPASVTQASLYLSPDYRADHHYLAILGSEL